MNFMVWGKFCPDLCPKIKTSLGSIEGILKVAYILHFILYRYLIKFQFLYQFLFFLGGNVICLDFWGRKSGPYIQALHFCLSLGLLTGPLLVDPLSQTHVPNVLQKALPFALSHPGKIVVEEWYCLIKAKNELHPTRNVTSSQYCQLNKVVQ